MFTYVTACALTCTMHTFAPIHMTIASRVLVLRVCDEHIHMTIASHVLSLRICDEQIHMAIASHVLLLRIYDAHDTCTMHTCTPIHITIASHVLLFRIYDAHTQCTIHYCTHIHITCAACCDYMYDAYMRTDTYDGCIAHDIIAHMLCTRCSKHS